MTAISATHVQISPVCVCVSLQVPRWVTDPAPVRVCGRWVANKFLSKSQINLNLENAELLKLGLFSKCAPPSVTSARDGH